MKMFEPVVIACDTSYIDGAIAIRSALEWFHLRVHLYHLTQKKNAEDFFSGNIVSSDYVVLLTGGLGRTNRNDESIDEMAMGFHRLVDQIDGKWDEVDFALTPANIPNIVNLKGRTVISLGCGAGRRPFADAFLKSGCKAYIAADGEVNNDAYFLFPVAFFYHLLSPEHPAAGECSDREAVERAASMDKLCKEGTHVFRYYTK